MTRQEKLILLLVSLVILGRLSGFGRDLYLAQAYGSNIPLEVELYWKNISVLFGYFVNVGAAIWLYLEAKTERLKAWVWAMLGLFFGIFGLVLFYVIQTYAPKRASEI